MVDLSSLLVAVLEKEEPGSTNYTIAAYLLQNSGSLNNISTSELAKACNVSKASISRFCKKIGLEDFFTLKVLIKNYTPGRTVPEKYNFAKTSEDDITNFINEYLVNVETLKKTLDRDTLASLAKDIHDYQQVYVMGIQQSAGIAMALQNDLMSFNKYLLQVSEPKIQREVLKNATSKDLILIFSATGSFFEKILSRTSFMKRKDLPRIYLVSVNHVSEFPYVYKQIILGGKYNYASNLLMNFYASLIAIEYKTKYSVS